MNEETKLRIEYIQQMQKAKLEGETMLEMHVRVFKYYNAEQARIIASGGRFLKSSKSA